MTTAAGKSELSLGGEFPDAGHETWLKLVDKILGGVPFDKKLVSYTYDGLPIRPLYTREDWNATGDPSGFPGGAPFTRGGSVLGTATNGWDIRQCHRHPDPAVVNRHILEDLERGVSSIVLKIDPSGQNGTCVRSAADFDQALKGVMLDLAPVVIDISSLPTIAVFANVLNERGVAKSFAGNFGADPLGRLAATGTMSAAAKAVPPRFADLAAYVARTFPKARTFDVSTLTFHGAGCGEAQELGIAMATATEYLRAMAGVGLDIDTACGQIAFTVAADTDMFLTIAKVRALRRLWARVAEASGAGPAGRIAPVTACTAPRMMSRRDPWVNILRTTIACFAAGIAGADAITVLPFDDALGLPQSLARRVARNTQVVLQEESALARVVDPAGGAWLFENLTDDLAAAAWAFFQKVERAGGMTAALTDGSIGTEIAAVRDARMKNIARRKDALTGVSEFPNIHEADVATDTADVAKIVKARDQGAVGTVGVLPAPDSNGTATAALVAAAKNGANVLALAQPLIEKTPMEITPLPQIRLGQDFERLRDAGDTFKAKYGTHPKIFLASLGTLAEFTPRATFAKNLFEAGGIVAVAGTGGTDAAAIAADFKRSGCDFAAICGTDGLYGEHATTLAAALKSAGAAMIYLAGRGGDQEAALKDAGVDGFIFMGCDAPQILGSIHSRLEAA